MATSNKEGKSKAEKLYIILAALMLICLAGSAVMLVFLPERVAMHYDISGTVDRIGSKYEMLIFPGIGLLMGGLFALVGKKESHKEERSNERVILLVGIVSTAFFSALGFFLMAKSLNGAVPKVESINTFVCIGMGLLLILFGWIMPKAQRNAAFGLRTSWSTANDRVWQKSQRFGGIALVTAGIVTVILSIFLPGIWSAIAALAVILAATVASVIASYRYYMQDRESTGSV